MRYRTDVIACYEDTDRRESFLAFLRRWAALSGTPLPNLGVPCGSIEAQISWGRWIASCPDGCGSAMLVSRETPIFYCVECGNGKDCYTVGFPQARETIEALLLKRPAQKGAEHSGASNRNWSPGETVEALEAENRQRGII